MTAIHASGEVQEMLAAALNERGDVDKFEHLSAEEQINTAETWDVFALAGLANNSDQGAETANAIVRDRVVACLARLVAPPHRLLAVMRDTDTVLADRHVNAIVFPEQPPGAESFLFYSPSHQYDTFCIYLKDILHAQFLAQRDDMDNMRCDDGGPGFEEYSVVSLNGHKVVVARSESLSPFSAVPWKKTTHYMNVISSRCIYIPYPWLMKDKLGRLRRDTDAAAEGVALKQGWDLRRDFRADGAAQAECLQNGLCARQRRHMGDSGTLVFQWDGERTAYPESELTVAWVLGGLPCNAGSCWVEVRREVKLAAIIKV
ncbi:hypothetical protein EIP86_001413 [Pleurotus ostreatoroseus]|nr:hypothetical protein EIP86_001413 [Pleurotus ostreatoroseus]